MTVVAAGKMIQMTDEGWDAVVTANGKGTFLIRRRKGHGSTQCPLLDYEVRRIDAGRRDGPYDQPAYSQESGSQSAGDAVARQPAAMLLPACAFHSPRTGCDRDERNTP